MVLKLCDNINHKVRVLSLLDVAQDGDERVLPLFEQTSKDSDVKACVHCSVVLQSKGPRRIEAHPQWHRRAEAIGGGMSQDDKISASRRHVSGGCVGGWVNEGVVGWVGCWADCWMSDGVAS